MSVLLLMLFSPSSSEDVHTPHYFNLKDRLQQEQLMQQRREQLKVPVPVRTEVFYPVSEAANSSKFHTRLVPIDRPSEIREQPSPADQSSMEWMLNRWRRSAEGALRTGGRLRNEVVRDRNGSIEMTSPRHVNGSGAWEPFIPGDDDAVVEVLMNQDDDVFQKEQARAQANWYTQLFQILALGGTLIAASVCCCLCYAVKNATATRNREFALRMQYFGDLTPTPTTVISHAGAPHICNDTAELANMPVAAAADEECLADAGSLPVAVSVPCQIRVV